MEICLTDYKTMDKIKNKPSVYLEPEFENRRSYYKRARIFNVDGAKVLVSYSTPIALYKDGELFKLQENDKYTLSWTTMRHLREFEKQMGHKVHYKKAWKERSI